MPSPAPVRTIALLCLVFLFALITFTRNVVWNDAIVLWLDVVAKSGNKPRPHHNLGTVYDKNGMMDKALEQYLIARDLDPLYADPHLQLGILYLGRDRIAEAREELETAVRLSPRNRKARLFLEYVRKQYGGSSK